MHPAIWPFKPHNFKLYIFIKLSSIVIVVVVVVVVVVRRRSSANIASDSNSESKLQALNEILLLVCLHVCINIKS